MTARTPPEPIVTAPLITTLETDARIVVRLNVSRLLDGGGVDSQSGAPSVEELTAHLLATLEQSLRQQTFVLDARVTWLDVELLAWRDW